MGRASVALGAPDSGSGIMDGSATRTFVFNTGPRRDPPVDVAETGKTLPQLETPEPARRQQHAPEAEDEVTRRQLWFQLSVDTRMQFGSCFSRMLLNCLSHAEHEAQEVTI